MFKILLYTNEFVEKITWLPLNQVFRKTSILIIISIIFALFLGSVNWLLQQGFNNLLS